MEKEFKKADKHAYCVMAHDDMYCLESLIQLLDFENNDIFLLIDKKSKSLKTDKISTKKSGLFIIPENRRIDIRWGGLSQVKAELTLFKEALNHGDYSYLHLISGADLPLKNQSEIHNWFDNVKKGSNFVTFSHGDKITENVNFKTRYYHPFVEFQRFRKEGNLWHILQDIGAKSWRKLWVKSQILFKYKRNWKDLKIRKGSQWVSITNDFAKYLIKNESRILKMFKGVLCPDEIFIHTIIYNSPFKETIWDYENLKEQNIRKIDWERGNPYTWKSDDFKELIESGSFFARKFNSKTDKEIIEKIKDFLLKGKK